MKKQLNILLLTFLILGQTILGPVGMAGAEEITNVPSNDAVQEDSQEADLDLEHGVEIEDPAEKPVVDESSIQKPDGGNEEGNPDITDEENKDKDSAGKEPSDKEEGDDESDVAPEEVKKEENLEGELDEETTEDDKPMLLAIEENINLQDDVTMAFDKLVVNGKEIRTADEAATVTPKLGDKVQMQYSFVINPEQDTGTGSFFEFDLPLALLNFNKGGLDGELNSEGLKFKYSTTNKTVKVELIEGNLIDGGIYSGTLNFSAEFSADGAKDGLDQELVIPVAGSDSITIPFIFKPKTDSGDQTMIKTGTSIVEGNDRYIYWEIWTNRKGDLLNDAKLTDETDGKHMLDGQITVEKYNVGLNGVGALEGAAESKSTFNEIALNGRYAYKIKYRTIVTHEQTEVTEYFTNTATLTNNGVIAESFTGSASHKYGLKLKKEATEKNKYKSSWQIRYNYFGSKVNSRTLTDTVTGPHKIIENTVKVYNVTVDSLGNGTKGSLVSEQPPIKITNPDLDGNGKGFTVDLSSPNGEAYIIEYDTVHDAEYVTEGESVKDVVNSVKFDEDNTSKDTIPITENIFSKTRSSIDFDNKIITWTISVNAEHAMKDFKIEDDFESYTEGGTRQKLVNPSNPFTISNSVIPIDTTLKGTDGDKGFTLKFGNLEEGKDFTITYQTEFQILPDGTTYSEYKNTATGSWAGVGEEGKPYSIKKSAKYSPGSSPTGKNGYKNGEFDHVNQIFDWNLAVNINKQEINGAILTDTIGEGHEIVENSIKVYKLNLSGNDEGTPDNEEVTTGFKFNEETNKKFVIEFNAPTKDAYIVKYQTKDTDNIIGNSGSNKYGNKAEFVTTIDQVEKKFTFEATAEVKNANELIAKTVQINNEDETITWTVDINKSHSDLGDSIELSDTMSDNQLLLPNTFKIRDITMDKEGNVKYENERSITPTTNTDHSFTLKLDDLTQKGYQIEYTTFFMGLNHTEFNNKATISYTGNLDGTSNEADEVKEVFVYNASSGTISSTKGKIELHKTGLNPITGVSTNLDDIKFELWNKSGSVKLAEDVTKNGGRLTFDNIRYGKYKLKESGTPTDYVGLPSGGLEINMNDLINFNENGGKLFKVENIEKVDPVNVCENFTLIIKNANGDPRKGVELTLTNENGKTTVTKTTGDDGEISVPRANLPAGKYMVKEAGDDGVNEELIVSYEKNAEGGCKAVVIQPEITCTAFTVTVKETVDKVRAGATVTLKKDGEEIITEPTDENGQFTVPTTTPAGEYTLYEGKQFLGKVVVDYNDGNCKFELTQAPTCPDFVLTVKDVDGKSLSASTVITVKDKNDESIVVANQLSTDSVGKLKIPNLKPSEYNVYDVNDNYIGSFAVDINCEAEVQPAPTCENFTLAVKDGSGQILANTKVSVKKDKNGSSVHTAVTDKDGKITIPSKNLPAGEYYVFAGDLFVDTITVSYIEKCEAIAEGAPVCTEFTLTVQNRSGKARPNVNIVIKDSDNAEIEKGTTDSNGQLKINKKMGKGKYRVYEGSTLINSFTVTDKCEATVKPRPVTPPPAQVCEDFIVTVVQNDKPATGKEVILKSGDKEVAKGKTDADGKVTFQNENVPYGEYDAYVDGEKAGKVEVTDTCEATITLTPAPALVCDDFTITVEKDGNPVTSGKEVVLKSGDKTIATGKTDTAGTVIFPNKDIPYGEYDAYVDGEKVGKVNVTDTCKAAINITSAPVCEDFTVTIHKSGIGIGAGTELVLKSSETEIIRSTTNSDSKVSFDKKQLPNGIYDAYVNGSKVDIVIVDDTCAAILNLGSTIDPGEPVIPGPQDPNKPDPNDPNKPGPEDPNKPNPNDPNKPGPEDPNKPDPNDPNKPGPEDPNKPNPNDPNKPGPEDPNKPNPNDPNKPGPEDPNKPDPNKPDPENPNAPDKPGTDGSNDPDNPGTSGKPGKPSNPGNSGTPVKPNKPGQSGSIADPNKNNGYQWANKGSKLPQTGEAYPILPLTVGVLLILAGLFALRRKKKHA